ncbi:MAG: hypothetical protein KC731_26150 [Myxococcales bacterium]|nr:hypothetical protein [Myxococcales bacterium]
MRSGDASLARRVATWWVAWLVLWSTTLLPLVHNLDHSRPHTHGPGGHAQIGGLPHGAFRGHRHAEPAATTADHASRGHAHDHGHPHDHGHAHDHGHPHAHGHPHPHGQDHAGERADRDRDHDHGVDPRHGDDSLAHFHAAILGTEEPLPPLTAYLLPSLILEPGLADRRVLAEPPRHDRCRGPPVRRASSSSATC